MATVQGERWVLTLELPPPSLQDNTADAERLIGALEHRLGAKPVDIDLATAAQLPTLLRDNAYRVRAIVFGAGARWQLVAVTADDTRPVLGLAVDLGTTRIVLSLVDLASGQVLGDDSLDNPQLSVGPDILTRIHFSDADDGLTRLQTMVVEGLNPRVEALCRAHGASPEHVVLMSLAGNTAMTHLFLGLNPRWMIREPYIPVINRPGRLKARDLGLALHPDARLFVFPNIGSYFGGDLIAGILHSGLHRRKGTAILVDVGTNAEVVLGNRDWLMACAGAAGPALEGGVSKIGTMACPGAIDRVRIDPQTRRFDLHTIGDQPPVGICGSGVIDLAAQLFLAGMLDIRGRIVPEACDGRLVSGPHGPALEILPPPAGADRRGLVIGQPEFDSLIRSKAAMYTILETITGAVGITPEALDTFFVAGTFGAYIDPESAITIGMLPDLPRERYQPLGNSSLEGAQKVLTDPSLLPQVDAIRDRITYMELNVNQDFMNRFSAAKFLPHTNPERFPSVVA
ncbi:MAG: ASKHA domain-containing protein [Desulfobacterales bacterium]|nr:ASKHA domain-containing protein [Desulfobacterales bacterium]MDJ0854853.1 ASKHA domain-containing protein [Desulfobacterales bacterium]MDJ0887173.1 ASKHA domain-containing protein [Desulfobacterales bacterium]MDJ0989767.1 ASKHA domain-containing protein [Desulfobacterales bacterium]